tara:strand:- start:153 stop:284 length:132 start_codon:yes stop_codon:yes gene_type:complete
VLEGCWFGWQALAPKFVYADDDELTSDGAQIKHKLNQSHERAE